MFTGLYFILTKYLLINWSEMNEIMFTETKPELA